MEPEQAENVLAKILKVEDEYDQAAAKIMVAFKNNERPSERPPQEAPATGGDNSRVKVSVELYKPFILSEKHNPRELKLWSKRFKSYYSVCNMTKARLEDQQMFFQSCLDPALYARIMDEIDADTPIFDDYGCMALLIDEFTLMYPLFQRRLQYFKSKQRADEKNSDFANRVVAMGNECDLSGISIGEFHVFQIICGLKDTKLQEKLLEMKPTSTQLMDYLKAVEVNSTTVKMMKEEEGSRSYKTETGGGKENKDKKDLKCYRCGAAKHLADKCPHKKTICHKCKKVGHIAAVCRTKNVNTRTAKTEASSESSDDGAEEEEA